MTTKRIREQIKRLELDIKTLSIQADQEGEAGNVSTAAFLDGKVAGLREAKAILKGLLQ